ncbi:hypothetical protein HN51_067943 [Arachis hypogaea]|uniref:Protein GLUTAMINE DUMPER n=1 Tax=Arachis hypogaea TaxID=3818 RepID=A0A444WN36_ARAHY|nr:protein GLUTAMINE DUMPER 6-like [Arachis ipaensis]XP_025648388.1 protein GLUTAMINE DUMPER 6-like [Arachis hypogaea]QHO09445.1 Protein GLUTAMINE DUMPER [Arachis hypogaea]RYQ78947.1 hypothetical protein Ahy_Scaffold8g108415 [Arachis hypogaea]
MRTTPSSSSNNSTTSADSINDFRNFHSPTPYLFGGLALMLLLIAISLLILACSFRKRYSSSSNNSSASGGDEENNNNNNNNISTKIVMDLEPNIVVIMAGETNPTYLAKPIISSVATTTVTAVTTASHSENQTPLN